MKKHTLLLLLFLVLSLDYANGQSIEAFQKKQFISSGDTLLYRIMYPKNYQPDQKYPLILFLHGAGERGNDNEKQMVHGSSLFLADSTRSQYPAIVVFPQCPKNDYWSNVNIITDMNGRRQFDFSKELTPTTAMQLVIALMDSLLLTAGVNISQLYVMGLSMGGMGAFELVKRKPSMFAAAVPICGGGNPESVDIYADKVAFWIFHGAKDDVVPPVHSQKMAEALQAINADVNFTLYVEANHNCWDAAFHEPDLFNWIFSKTKKL